MAAGIWTAVAVAKSIVAGLFIFFRPRLFDLNLQEKSRVPVEQIRCRDASLVAVLTVRLMSMCVNYSIVRASRHRRRGPRIAVLRAQGSQQKHPEAVKCTDGGKSAAWRRREAQTGRSFWDVPVPRRCAVAGRR